MKSAMTTGMSVVQMLTITLVDPLQRSESQTEQCSTWSLKIEQALSWAPCLLHDRVICLTPWTVNNLKNINKLLIIKDFWGIFELTINDAL